MNGANPIEKTNLSARVRDIRILFIFILLAAVLSAVVMDILILPITLFAIHFKQAFNFFIRDVFWIGVIAVLIALFARRVYVLRKNGLKAGEIIKHAITRPLAAVSLAFIVGFAAIVLVYCIYLLLHYNGYFIYRILN